MGIKGYDFGWLCVAAAVACADNGGNGPGGNLFGGGSGSALGGSGGSGSALGGSGGARSGVSGGSSGAQSGSPGSGVSGGSSTGSGSGTGGSGGSSGGTDGGLPACSTGGSGGPPQAFAGVFTQHNDNLRTGANLSETVLATANVNSSQFGKLFCWAVDDQVYTQPLVVPGVNLTSGGMHDVVYVASMNDTVYAFDANATAASMPLWSRSLLGPGAVAVAAKDLTGACGGNYKDISGNIGVVGTPVIDPATSTMYLVARTKENGNTFVQRLHAMDIRNGKELQGSPVTITASVAGTGDGATTVVFDPQRNNQRASLLLDGGAVYISFSSHCDWGPYHGWILGYDAQNLQQVAVYNSTPDGSAAGIWMAGQGPAADGKGGIYVLTGNGTVGTVSDPTSTRNRGESFLRLVRNGGALEVASWFTPHEYPRMEAGDLDLGSAGPLLVPGTNAMLGAGKNAKVYTVDRTTMGGLGTARNDPPSVQVAPLGHLHVHGGPVYWNGPGGPLVYTWAEYDTLKSFHFDPATSKLDPLPLATSPSPAPDGMPGGFLSISANGSSEGTGIVWAYLPLKDDANQAVVGGELHAFDAANVGVELWNSTQNPNDSPGNYGKFTSPTVAKGRVYLSTFSNAVCVYGILPNVQPLAAPSGLTVTAMSKTHAALQWTPQSTTETGFAVERREGLLGFASIATAPKGASSFVDTTALPYATYSYRVRALGQPAPSAYSNSACVQMNVGAAAPRLRVTGAGHAVADGSTAVAWTSDTDFGGVDLNAKVSHSFTIENAGAAPLHVSGVTIGGANAGDFAVDAPPPAQIAQGGAGTFGLAFSPKTVGWKTATVQVASDDPDQAMYTFAVAGMTTGDLVGWWKLDETTGNSAADASGERNTGTANNVAWVAGHTGGAAAFDGSTSYVSVKDNASLNPYALTIGAWINPADWMGNRRIVQKGAFDDQYRLTAENNMLKFDIAGVGGVAAPLPPTNTWSHVAGTYDGSRLLLYVNGAQVAAAPATGMVRDGPDPLYIGSKPPNPSPTLAGPAGSDSFHGMLDEVHVVGRALSGAEIAMLAR